MPNLADVAKINPRFKRSEIDDLSERVSFVPMASVSQLEGAISSEEDRTLSDVIKGFTPFQDRDVLLAKITPCFENGKIAHARISRRLGFGSTEFHVIRPEASRLDDRYLYHFLRRPFVREEGERRMTGSAGQKRVPKAFLEALDIPLPPLPEQRRIAAILDKADALRAKRREAIAKLDQLLQSVFLDMFGDGLSAKHPVVPLPDAFWFQEGPGVRKWQFQDAGIKLLNVGNIEKDGSINLSKTDRHISLEEAHGKYKHFLVDEGDLVIASSGISFDDDGLLRTRGGFITGDYLPLCMNTSTVRFKSVAGKSRLGYLHAWIDSVDFREQISRLVTGSAQKNFGPSHLRQLVIPLPSLDEQAAFEKKAAAVRSMKKQLQASLSKMDATFVALQQLAFAEKLAQSI